MGPAPIPNSDEDNPNLSADEFIITDDTKQEDDGERYKSLSSCNKYNGENYYKSPTSKDDTLRKRKNNFNGSNSDHDIEEGVDITFVNETNQSMYGIDCHNK